MPAVFCCCQKTKRRGTVQIFFHFWENCPQKTPSFVREVKIFVVAQARVCCVCGGGANPLKNIVIYGADIPQIYSFCAKKLAKTVLPRIFAAKL